MNDEPTLPEMIAGTFSQIVTRFDRLSTRLPKEIIDDSDYMAVDALLDTMGQQLLRLSKPMTEGKVTQ